MTTKTKSWLQRGRISPRDVLEAYERTGWTPSRDAWISYGVHDNELKTIACGAAVVGKSLDPNMLRHEVGVFNVFEKRDFSCAYIEGFGWGFDGNAPLAKRFDEWHKGWRDGRRAARFVFGAYPVTIAVIA